MTNQPTQAAQEPSIAETLRKMEKTLVNSTSIDRETLKHKRTLPRPSTSINECKTRLHLHEAHLINIRKLLAQEEMWSLINQLRESEGSGVELISDNPDFDGPACAIRVTDGWTAWEPRTFYGETIQEALTSAMKARTQEDPSST